MHEEILFTHFTKQGYKGYDSPLTKLAVDGHRAVQ